MDNFTFFDYHKLTEDEKALNRLIESKTEKKTTEMPSKKTINNILAYSKAISVRKSEQLGFIENVLN